MLSFYAKEIAFFSDQLMRETQLFREYFKGAIYKTRNVKIDRTTQTG